MLSSISFYFVFFQPTKWSCCYVTFKIISGIYKVVEGVTNLVLFIPKETCYSSGDDFFLQTFSMLSKTDKSEKYISFCNKAIYDMYCLQLSTSSINKCFSINNNKISTLVTTTLSVRDNENVTLSQMKTSNIEELIWKQKCKD